MMWFVDLFQRELGEIRHDMRRPAFLFGAALAYLIVFGMLYPSIYEVEHPEEECAYKTWQIMFVKTVVYWLLGMLSYGLVVAVVTQGGHAARQPVLPADASLEHGARALPHRQLAALLGQHRKARSARHRVLPRWWRAVAPPAAAEPPGSRWMKLVPEPSPRSRFPLASRRFLLFEKCK